MIEYWLKGSMPTYGGYKCSKCGYQTTKYGLSKCPSCGTLMYVRYVGYVRKPKWYKAESEDKR